MKEIKAEIIILSTIILTFHILKIKWLSHPDLSYLSFLYYLFRSGCDKGGLGSFVLSSGFCIV